MFRIYRGWDARAAYFLNTDTYYRNQTGTKPVFNTGNISVTCTGSYLGGGSVIINWPVDLSGGFITDGEYQ